MTLVNREAPLRVRVLDASWVGRSDILFDIEMLFYDSESLVITRSLSSIRKFDRVYRKRILSRKKTVRAPRPGLFHSDKALLKKMKQLKNYLQFCMKTEHMTTTLMSDFLGLQLEVSSYTEEVHTVCFHSEEESVSEQDPPSQYLQNLQSPGRKEALRQRCQDASQILLHRWMAQRNAPPINI